MRARLITSTRVFSVSRSSSWREIAKAPAESNSMTRSRPDAAWRITTLTLGTTPPVKSRTTPDPDVPF